MNILRHSDTTSPPVSKAICYSALVMLIIFTIKLALISRYANPLPFWDQWDAEADLLYLPWLDGTLNWEKILRPHAEHRIVMTKILDIFLYWCNGGWSVILQMIVNATIHVLALTVLLISLLRTVEQRLWWLVALFAVCLFAIPAAWENILWGFQSQVYFAMLFGLLGLWFLIMSEPLSIKWWGGCLFGTAAFLSYATGLFAFVAPVAVLSAQFILGIDRRKRLIAAAVILTACVMACYMLTPVIPQHAPHKAQSFAQFYDALKVILIWPTDKKKYALGVWLYLPSLLLAASLIRQRPPASDPRWFLLGVILWCLGQAIAIAYGRTSAPVMSRYRDVLAIGLFANFVALLTLLPFFTGKGRIALKIGLGIFVVIVFNGFSRLHDNISAEIKQFVQNGRNQQQNVRAYLCTGDSVHLENKPRLDLPYPDAARLKYYLDNREVRRVLPHELTAPGACLTR